MTRSDHAALESPTISQLCGLPRQPGKTAMPGHFRPALITPRRGRGAGRIRPTMVGSRLPCESSDHGN